MLLYQGTTKAMMVRIEGLESIPKAELRGIVDRLDLGF